MASSEASWPALDLQLDDQSWDIEVQIFNLIANFLQARSHHTAAQKAASIDAILFSTRRANTETKAEDPASFLLEFWELVFRIAEQIPPNHPAMNALATLVLELKRLDKEMLVIWGHPIKLWSDLPLLGPQLTETCESMSTEVWERSRLRELVLILKEMEVVDTWVV
ncbi:hypothetical protein NU195Hw_g9119t1 [Hortaea werneckii]